MPMYMYIIYVRVNYYDYICNRICLLFACFPQEYVNKWPILKIAFHCSKQASKTNQPIFGIVASDRVELLLYSSVV